MESKPRKITQGNRRLTIGLPSELAQQVGWKAGDSITWEIRDNAMIVRKART